MIDVIVMIEIVVEIEIIREENVQEVLKEVGSVEIEAR